MAQGRDAAYATASKVMVDNLALRDGQEGIQAFIEKRKPVWNHKVEKAHDWGTYNLIWWFPHFSAANKEWSGGILCHKHCIVGMRNALVLPKQVES